MVVEIGPTGATAQGAPAQSRSAAAPTSRGETAAPVARPQQDGAQAAQAATPQNATDDAEDKRKEAPRQKPARPSLADLGGTRLSILQDEASERFVYRGIDAETREVVRQVPSEAELARAAYLRQLRTAANEDDQG